MSKITAIYSILLGICIIFTACKTTEKTAKADAPQYDLNKLYKVWDVASITTGGRAISGPAMGDPRYEFTQEGQRIKSYEVPPHSEFVDYIVRNDSIHYKGEKQLPSVAIKELTDSTLVLSNEKAEWKLYIKK